MRLTSIQLLLRLAVSAMIFALPVAASAQARATGDTIRMQLSWKVSSEESRAGEEFGMLSSIAVDALDNVYVADLSAVTIRVFGANGQPFRSIGRKGKGPGEFISPAGLGIGPDGMLYVRDQERHTRFKRDAATNRLTQYDGVIARAGMSDASTKYPVKFVSAESFIEPHFTMFTRPPTFSGRYYRVSMRGQIVDSVMVPIFPNSPPPMTILRVSASGGRMIYGMNQVPFAAIPVWDITSNSTLISGLGNSYLLTERDASGKVLQTYQRTVAAERIPPRERADSVAALKRRIDSLPAPISKLEGVPPEVARLELPQTFPFYSAVFSAADGKVWVRRWINGSNKRTVFDVFAREGQFLSTVSLPAVISSTVPPVLSLDRIFAVVVDPETGENMLYAFAVGARR